jgi:hypothetical protein
LKKKKKRILMVLAPCLAVSPCVFREVKSHFNNLDRYNLEGKAATAAIKKKTPRAGHRRYN